MLLAKIQIHKEICDNLNTLYSNKNADYGDSFKVVRDKYPHAILIRLNDKLSRLEQLYKIGEKEMKVKDESIEDTLRDLANYALMELTEIQYDKMCGGVNGCK